MKRSKHSLSKYSILTGNMGELIPLGKPLEVLPGDTIQHATSLLVRMSPLLSPVMHPLHVRVHHWFVPHRLVWTDWENFITGGPDGLNASVFPTITPNTGSGYAVGSLADYLGVPTGVDDKPHSALPFRGYALIWNEWYRDPDLETALTIDKTDGADTTTNVDLKNVCWEKDYFTSARLYAQKGPDVTLPLGTEAPIYGKNMAYDNAEAGNNYAQIRNAAGSSASLRKLSANLTWLVGGNATTGTGELMADLSQATAATINELREALAIQRYEEARARYGSRYTEYLRYLGVRSSDARLQRPEYLGGGKQTIQFSEVLQTGVTTSGTPSTGVGSLLGHGIGAVRSNRYRRFFEEHGYVFSLMSVVPKTLYCDGLPRDYSRATKEDFYQKELEHIGQQEVLKKEVYWNSGSPDAVFGYQDRYDEYRRQESSVHGDFRSTLNYWHLGRILGGDPTLNASFVSCSPATRIFQSTASDQLEVMASHSIQARRLVAKMGTSRIF